MERDEVPKAEIVEISSETVSRMVGKMVDEEEDALRPKRVGVCVAARVVVGAWSPILPAVRAWKR